VLRLLSDENFNNDVVRGAFLRRDDLDLIRVQDVGLAGVEDPVVLAWADSHGRILLTHDRRTIPKHAYARVAAGQSFAGVFIVNDRAPVARVIDDLLLLADGTEQAEWVNRIEYLPL
jgi:hypothetical protein